ncbi:MAG: AsmA family protein [Desulfobacterales bacterium]|jgi:AsmA protein|nr:AsmA family protein [Desulfobacterales bacterium]MDH3878330.1 AsmA family protein [Desulfobacterales bacterium]
MNKAIKWGLIICASLVVLVIAVLLIAPAFIDIRDYKPQLEKKVADATGRPFSVGDDLSLSLFPWAGISFSDLRLGNRPGFSEKELVTVKSFEVRVKLLPLISKDIQVKRFILNEPNITLVKNKTGQVNWAQSDDAKGKSAAEKTAKASKSEQAEAGLPIKDLTVGEFLIKNGSIIWIDHTANTRKEITAVNLKLRDVSLERPVTLSFSALLDNQPLSIDGTVGPVGKDFKQATIPLALDIKALKELILQLNGKVSNPGSKPGIDMAVEIKAFSPRKLMAALDQKFPVATSDPDALGRVALKANLKGDQKKLMVSDGILNLDESTLKFSLTASDFSRPNLAFDFNLDRIDADRYLPPKSEQPPAAKKPTQKQATDYEPLRKLILDGRIQIGQLVVNKAKIEDLHLQIKAKNGIFNLDPLKLDMYQGNVSGVGNFNVQTNTPKSSLSLNVENIQAGPLLRDVLEKDILEGAANARIKLAMSGDDAAMIKKTLDGNGEVRFNDGAIIGIDLAGMVRNVKAAFGLEQKPAQRPRTDFAELNAPFSINQGNVNTPQTSLKSPLIRVIAAGDANLVKETLDFRVEPKVVGTIKGQGDTDQRSGLMVPVLVTGTFSKPRFAPDLAGMAKKQLEETILGSGQDGQKLDKENLEETAKGVLKGILGQ